MKMYSVLIIGAGKIGAFFDTPQSGHILTHAHAFTAHPGFHLAGFVDADMQQAQHAAAVWGGEAFSTLSDAFSRHAVDVVVIAAPDKFHYSILKELAAYLPQLVFAEKPLTSTVAQADEIIGLYRNKGIRLAVNYSRRFVPEIAALRAEITGGACGNYLTGAGYYGKGTLHNGSHLIDLVRFLVGEVKVTRAVSHVTDFYDTDPSCSAILTLDDDTLFHMQAVDCRCYTIFELDLLFEKRRIRITDAGFSIEVQNVRESYRFAGYHNLKMSHTMETQLDNALYAAAGNIHDHLDLTVPLLCDGDDGRKAISVSRAILQAIA